MSSEADFSEIGFFPLRDHEAGVPPSIRRMVAGGIVEEMDDEGTLKTLWIGGHHTLGDLNVYRFWPGGSRGFGSFSTAFAAVVGETSSSEDGPTTSTGGGASGGGAGSPQGSYPGGMRPGPWGFGFHPGGGGGAQWYGGSPQGSGQGEGTAMGQRARPGGATRPGQDRGDKGGGGAVTPGEEGDREYSLRPIQNAAYSEDARYQARAGSGPKWLPKWAKGTIGIGMVGTIESRMDEVFMPTDPRIVIVHANPSDECGSYFTDLDPKDTLSKKRSARGQTGLRVVLTPDSIGTLSYAKAPSLALNFAHTEQGNQLGLGMVVAYTVRSASRATTPGENAPNDPPKQPAITPSDNAGTGGVKRGSVLDEIHEAIDAIDDAIKKGNEERQAKKKPQKKVVNFLAWDGGGPLCGGDEQDVHVLGADEDQHKIQPSHIHIGALFFSKKEKDGPLMFEDGDYPAAVDGPIAVKVHLVWDKTQYHQIPASDGMFPGKWRWYASSLYGFSGPPKDGPPNEPNDPEPPPNDGPPTEPTDPETPRDFVTPAPGFGRPRYPEDDLLPPPEPRDPSSPGGAAPATGEGGGAKEGSGAKGEKPAGTKQPKPKRRRRKRQGKSTWFSTDYDEFTEEWDPVAKKWKRVPGSERKNGKPIPSKANHVAVEQEAMAYSFLQQTKVVSLFRAQDLRSSAVDLRRTMNADEQETDEANTTQPVTARFEGFAKIDQAGFEYMTQPGASRYAGGTAKGGVAFMVPEASIDDHDEDFASVGMPSSPRTYLAMTPGTALTFGVPDPSTGDMKACAWAIKRSASSATASTIEVQSFDGSSWTTVFAGVKDSNGLGLGVNGTGYFKMPSGTTAQRPGTPSNGMTRYNSTLGYIEGYSGGSWQSMIAAPGTGRLVAVTAYSTAGAGTHNWNASATSAIVIGIGGGGGGGGVAGATAGQSACAGGGGAGGMFVHRYATLSGGTASYAVGSGGAGGAAGGNAGTAGGDTTFDDDGTTYTAKGGGGGSFSAESAGTASVAGGSNVLATGSPNMTAGAGNPGAPGFKLGAAVAVGGLGGCSHLGGAGGLGGLNDAAGSNGIGPGAGGGGASSTSASANNYAGGDGKDGMILVYEYS